MKSTFASLTVTVLAAVALAGAQPILNKPSRIAARGAVNDARLTRELSFDLERRAPPAKASGLFSKITGAISNAAQSPTVHEFGNTVIASAIGAPSTTVPGVAAAAPAQPNAATTPARPAAHPSQPTVATTPGASLPPASQPNAPAIMPAASPSASQPNAPPTTPGASPPASKPATRPPPITIPETQGGSQPQYGSSLVAPPMEGGDSYFPQATEREFTSGLERRQIKDSLLNLIARVLEAEDELLGAEEPDAHHQAGATNPGPRLPQEEPFDRLPAAEEASPSNARPSASGGSQPLKPWTSPSFVPHKTSLDLSSSSGPSGRRPSIDSPEAFASSGSEGMTGATLSGVKSQPLVRSNAQRRPPAAATRPLPRDIGSYDEMD